MKRLLYLLFIYLLTQSVFATERKKVGLVLGGGGAKGVAHIGVLKVLEEAGIPIDYIAGTSMGAIVGGLYAIGYNAAAIDSMVNTQDWVMLLSDRVNRSSQSFPEKENSERFIVSLPFGKEKKDRVISGVIRGQNLQNLFSDLTIGYHDSVDFNRLPIPFAAVAQDIVNGNEYVFHQGSLPLAMRASMAIPAVFTPVHLDSMVLIDGGLNNNYPADVVRAMGAEIIIGVDLGTSDLKLLEGINTPGDVIGQIIALYGHTKYDRNKKQTDLLFRPDMHPYNAASFTAAALDTLIRRGEQNAREHWTEILALKEKIGVTEEDLSNRKNNLNQFAPEPHTKTLFIQNIYFEGIDPRDEQWLKKISGLKENQSITLKKLQEVMSIIVGTNVYTNVSYKLTGEKQQDLILTVQEKSISSLNGGLRFDTEEIVGVLLNATLDLRAGYRSKFALTGKIGKNSYGQLDYIMGRSPLRHFNLSYKFGYHDLDIYHKGEKIINSTYRNHFAELAYSDMNWLNFKFKIGLRYEYFDYNSFLYTDNNHIYDVKPEGFISYFALAHLETLDRRYFPTRGVSMQAHYSLYTDNFVTYNDQTPFSALGADFMAVAPLTHHLSLLPSIYGRTLIGRNHAFPYLNTLGGETFGKYLPQQLPFAGINHMEVFNNSIVVVRMHLRQQLWERHYLSLIGNYGLHHHDFFHLLDGEDVWGGSIGYAYNSIAGPISAHFGMSNRNSKVQFYLNMGFNF
ncbi:patatin-like phospholipase family protein [Parabacteroides sp. PF5-9]|uniref:patatin-like phospholipase family protein n=1 Tax=Parabacteroides sp. PF5-9 TaxID=1742404 RepID=UPI002474A442|nr:patatin-like phospholipase family protein [Parabacteroides sp. PF5-9]MDH6356673.1 NTE family protein [Parabacteroides sp. PF5-9]